MNKKVNKSTTLIIAVFVVIFLLCSISGSISVSLAVACLCAFPVSLAVFIIKTLTKQKSIPYLFSSIALIIAFILFLAIAPTPENKELETTTNATTTTTETTTEETTTTVTTTITTTTTTETTTVEVTTAPPAPVVSSNNSNSSSYSDVSKDDTADIVYIGKTGTKYHRQNCRTLKGNGSPISLSDAKAQNKTACKVCKP